jgi:hypothetical protein
MWLEREKPKSQIDQVVGSMQLLPMREEILSSLTELNLQCLEMMAAEQGTVYNTRTGGLLLREVSHRWGNLDAEARRRAASCPYLLVDAGFGEPDRWLSGRFTVQSSDTPAFFTGERCLIVARQVFLYAWYLSKTEKFDGRVLLGMSSGCMEALRSHTLLQVLELAERSTNWICPRWPHLVGFWRELLLAAKSGEFAALEAAKMHGIPLLAGDSRSASVRALNVERVAAATASENGPSSRALPCDSGETLFDQVAGGGRVFRFYSNLSG